MDIIGSIFTITLLILLIFWPFLAVIMAHKLNQPSSALTQQPKTSGCSCKQRRCAEQAGEGNKKQL